MFKKGKFWSYFAYALGEILLIVVGILIALYLQNRNEKKKTDQIVNTTLSLLKDEIEVNKNMVLNVKDYHIMARDTLKILLATKKEEELIEKLGFWKGMRTPRLQNAAFQTSIQSGVNREFNPKLLQVLNRLYTIQDSYNDFNSRSTSIFFNADLSDNKQIGKIMSSVQITMEDLYYHEKGLVESYDYCLQKIDSLQKVK